MSVNKIKKSCNICEFKDYQLIFGVLLKDCEMKNEKVRFPRLKALFCKWFTLDSKRRKAIEKFYEIQTIR